MKSKTISIFAPMVRQLVKAVNKYMEQVSKLRDADELGALQAVAGPLNKRIDELKKQMWQDYGPGRVVGELFEAMLYEQPYKYIAADKVRDVLQGPALEMCEIDGVRKMCDVHAITGRV